MNAGGYLHVSEDITEEIGDSLREGGGREAGGREGGCIDGAATGDFEGRVNHSVHP